MVLKGIERDIRALRQVLEGENLEALYNSLPNESNAQELYRYIKTAEGYQRFNTTGKISLLNEEGLYLVVGINESLIGVATLLDGPNKSLCLLCRDTSSGVGSFELKESDEEMVVKWGVIDKPSTIQTPSL